MTNVGPVKAWLGDLEITEWRLGRPYPNELRSMLVNQDQWKRAREPDHVILLMYDEKRYKIPIVSHKQSDEHMWFVEELVLNTAQARVFSDTIDTDGVDLDSELEL